jgi:hypothetical protein
MCRVWNFFNLAVLLDGEGLGRLQSRSVQDINGLGSPDSCKELRLHEDAMVRVGKL